jgi:hypothetical protein
MGDDRSFYIFSMATNLHFNIILLLFLTNRTGISPVLSTIGPAFGIRLLGALRQCAIGSSATLIFTRWHFYV